MNPIPEEKEEDEEEEEEEVEVAEEGEGEGDGEGASKKTKMVKRKKKKSLIKQEEAINQYFDEMIAENLHGPLASNNKNNNMNDLQTPPENNPLGIAAVEQPSEPLLPMISSKASKERFSSTTMESEEMLIDRRAQPKSGKNNNSSSSSLPSLPPLGPSSQK